MPEFVVLLRGVNVGKGNRVAMAEFRALLEGLGYTDVRTLLNSGNAVFRSRGSSETRHAQAVADALARKLGLSVPVIVMSAADFLEAIEGNPAIPDEPQHSSFIVAFGQRAEALQALQGLMPLVGADEHFSIGPRAAYLRCSPGILESKAAAALLGKMGRGVTTRNWATVIKLKAMLNAAPEAASGLRPSWMAMRKLPAKPFYPCHVENAAFDQALLTFGAKPTRFKATVGAPRAGRHFLLRLPSRRFAIVTNYDDFPRSLEFSVQITSPSKGPPVAHIEDLTAVLVPLGLPVPDKSNDGALKWLPPRAGRARR